MKDVRPSFEAVGLPGLTLKGGRGCICTLTPSSDWLGGSRWSSDRGGMTLRAAAAAFNVSPATAHRWWHRWLEAGDRSAHALCSIAPAVRTARHGLAARAAAADLRLPPPDRLGAAAGRRRDRLPHSTVWKVLAPGGLSRRPPRARSRPTATSGPARVICCTWTSPATRASGGPATGDRRPLAALAQLDARRDAGRIRLRARDRRRPLAPGLRRAPRRREGADRDRLRRAGLAFFAEHGIVASG